MTLAKNTFIVSTLILSLLPALSVQAQTRRISPADRTHIVQAILKRENFRDSEMWRDDSAENTVYLLAENISPDQLPPIKGIRFAVIPQQQVEEMKKTGVEYYRFGELRFRQSRVRVSLVREYLGVGNSNGSVTEYTCRKVAGRWRVSGRLGARYTAESK